MSSDDGITVQDMSRQQTYQAGHAQVEDEYGRDGGGHNSAVPEQTRVKRVTWGEAETWTLAEEDRGGLSESGDEEEGKVWEDAQDGMKAPWFVAPVLVCAVVAISSAGAVMKSMSQAAPMTRAGWRLQLTALLLLPGFIWQWCRIRDSDKQRFLHRATLSVMFISGLSLAIHFGLWVWSLDHTSLPHSLLLVSMPPVILSAVRWFQCKPLSKKELGGVGLSVIGLVLVAAASQVELDREVTILGDIVAFLAAVAFAIHLSAGHSVRGWMPLFIYTFPVTAVAAILLSIAGVSFEGWSHTESGLVSGPFNWAQREFLLPTIYLAVGPGLIGHTGLNAVLGYTSSLGVAAAITMEPAVGTVIGWLLHQTPEPGLWTCVGGALLLVGTIFVIHANEERKASKELKHFATIDDFDEGPGGEHWNGSDENADEDIEQRKSLITPSQA